MNRAWIPALGLVVLALFPDVVHACAVCFDARDENRQAFLATTAFLSLLPLGMVAGAGLWVRKRSRQIDADIGAKDRRGKRLRGFCGPLSRG
ncbi:MAG: hypothetical protein VX815_15685 [Gemmatimonadota bacterium]|nr:hypothetical protein [Gemmatimonadota bacterium]